MRRRKQKSEREPTIALINIVFLMLVFFLVAGTVARPLDPDLKLVHTADLQGAAPADALVLHADGTMSVQGTPIEDSAAALEMLGDGAKTLARIVPDRDLPAADLIRVGRELRAAGAEKVVIVTERGLE
ncbi:biopolymer transporter ExbD [Salipiger sp. CCB-MM3]|uniref:ExbD/TolR family protein n=1 Tax=Roseobacteraceae TaxID=2854170 RepID=UPI00080AAB42|nr:MULTISPECIES: biopolymer transporter ExbD [Roseobacteraceae]ANT61977.1 biopolymer transporter ExbD [Salipiger sp. CCB-MM3]MCA0998513.1 biopolymer transporter ExbD [Alloyangia pacifica]